MSLRVATPELVHQQVKAVLKKVPTARALAVRAEPRWSGGPLEVDGRHVTVTPCPSPLAVRAALAEHLDPVGTGSGAGGGGVGGSAGTEVVVIICDLADAELGQDVLARLAGARVWGLEPWNAVQGLFGVKRLDAAFRKDQGWIAEALLAHVPADTARSLTGRTVLSVEVALDALARQILGADHLSIDGIIAAATADNGGAPFARLADVEPQTRDGLLAALAERHGPLGALVAAIAGNGHGPDLVAVGLAARAVYGHGEHDGGRPAGHFEARLGIAEIEPATAAALATRGEEALDALAGFDADRAHTVLASAATLAADVGADHPEASDWLPAGFDRRLEIAAGLIDEALDRLATPAPSGGAPAIPGEVRAALNQVTEAVERAADHRASTTRPGRRRLAHLHMTARLLTWLATPDEGPDPVSFEEAAAAYAAEGAWVDRARRRLWHGDTDPHLGATYRRVIDAAVARRRPQNQRFAELLAAWTTTPGAPSTRARHRLVCVEDVAAEIVAPLAQPALGTAKPSEVNPVEANPVLMVVLDGCGLASFGELAGQFAELGYRELVPIADGGAPATRWSGVAALPTVTEVSRASLLAGRLDRGNQDHERRQFEACEALRIGGRPGVLFHQNRLPGPAGTALAPEVTAALAGSGPAVVGVVINTVDDHLKKGTFPDEVTLGDLTALVPLLDTARTHGRTVIVTADHGHVLAQPDDGGTGGFQGGGTGGERWRHADREPETAEVVLRGDRVVLGGNAGVLAPWDDDFRYGAKAGGYHGGATPEEVLVPVAVFGPAGLDPLPGWEHSTPATPLWWDLYLPAELTAPPAPATPAPPPTKPRRRPKVDESQPAMFDVPVASTPEVATAPASSPGPASTQPAPGEPAWVAALMTSEVWQLQRGATGVRAPLAEDRVRAVLSALHRRGGVASFAILSTEAGVPAGRLAGFLTHLARLLNVDGYAVLEVDSPAGEARLSLPLLAQQFEITGVTP